MDELILRVGSRTLARLDAALTAAESAGSPSPAETLVRIAVAYCDFAAENLDLWRALFEHRMAPDKPVPEWAVEEQMNLFRHIYHPLAKLFPKWSSGRTRHHRAQPVCSRARHGQPRARAETDRGAGRGSARRDRDHRQGDDQGVELAKLPSPLVGEGGHRRPSAAVLQNAEMLAKPRRMRGRVHAHNCLNEKSSPAERTPHPSAMLCIASTLSHKGRG